MANEVKWIKITTDIFEPDGKLFAIESLSDGYLIEVVWFKLLVLTGKLNNNGFVVNSAKIPFTDEMLSQAFRIDLGTVQRALEIFQNYGMVEVVDNAYMISNWLEHQNGSGLEDIKEKNRLRQQRHRDKQKQLLNGEKCVYCGKQATGVDHIVPLSKGGSDDDENKVSCCVDCNRIKNNKPLVDFLNYNLAIIDKESISNNEKIARFVSWDSELSRYVTLQNNVNCSISYSLSNSNSYSDSIKEIIDYINLKTNSRYTYKNKVYNKHITGRLNDGFTVDDFKTVIDKMYDKWHSDPKMAQYLTPDTLFAQSKFEKYLNMPVTTEKSDTESFLDKWRNA